MSGCIVGWAHTKFGKLEDEDLESLIAEARPRRRSLTPGSSPAEIDAIYVGNFGGFEKQGFPASLALADPALRFRPATRVENACASGSAAIRVRALNDIARRPRPLRARHRRGEDDLRLRRGGRRHRSSMPPTARRRATPRAASPAFSPASRSSISSATATRSEALARIAAKNHANGVANPYAQIRKDLGFDFCNRVSDKNPIVAGPLRRTDCSLVSDGAAAIVLDRN